MILSTAKAAGLSDKPAAASKRSQPIAEKAAQDEVAYVAEGDPAMTAAMRKARETLAGFLDLADTPASGMEGFAVKVAIPDGCDTEYFWIHPFERDGGQFYGRLNNTPSSAAGLKMGGRIAFTESDIVDWMYMERGMMRGNYTARALLKNASQEDKDAFKRQYGLDSDF